MGFMDSGFQLERKDKGHGKQFFGKYRAIVTNNLDDNKETGRMGRIKVKCPKVFGEDESDWCTPCMPFAGKNVGMLFMPKVGDTVWIEFEEGDPNLPIWVGNWWGVGEIPSEINDSYNKKEVGLHHVIKMGLATIYINEKDKYLLIRSNGGDTIIRTLGGEYIVNP